MKMNMLYITWEHPTAAITRCTGEIVSIIMMDEKFNRAAGQQ